MSGKYFHVISLIAAPIFAAMLGCFLIFSGHSNAIAITAAITFICAVWWVTEPIPIPATSLIPLAVFPLLGVLTPTQVAEAYGSPIILLLMGGFILSTAMESSGAHRKIALQMVKLFGGNSHRRIVFGFMFASALMSMWISNTATTLMLLPIALAVLKNSDGDQLTLPLLLGICYAASLGGIGTPIGTPPNLIFMQVYTENTGVEITFQQWMSWALPVVLIFLPIMAFCLTRKLNSRSHIEIPETRDWTQKQKRVLYVFAFTAFFWVTRKEPFGGWSELLELPNANDAAVALIAVVAMFALPDGKEGRLLDWQAANKIPWGMLLLFAGGIAIAKAFNASGLAAELADSFTLLTILPVFLMIILICLIVTFLTEMTSNTATTSLLMPIMLVASLAVGIEPMLLMVPAAMSASCAFMLPVATAPNAIVFGSGKVPIQKMAQAGLLLNFIGTVVISAVCYFSFI